MKQAGMETRSIPGWGRGGTLHDFIGGGSTPRADPFTIFERKGTPFIYLLLKMVLGRKAVSKLLTAINAPFF